MTDTVTSSVQRPSSSHSSHAMSTRSGDGTLARQVGPDTQPLASPPRGRLDRKRAASINVDEANQPRIQDLSLDSASSAASSLQSGSSGRDLICLCTPAPKVPRPRNAFILYRQHHQGQVVAQNPGLANPEISKIIGEQWRDQPEEVKNSWKRLAEEEKARHQRQYPDYRYQPRRGGKGAAARPTSSGGEDPSRCPKCGGRYIATPRTPSTPFLTPTASKPIMPPYITPNPRVIETDHLRHYNQNNMPANGMRRHFTQHSVHERDEDYEAMSPTSDHKRRRFEGPGHFQPVSPYGHYPQQRQIRASSISGQPHQIANYPLPGPSMIARQVPGTMAPPPRPSVAYSHGPRNPAFDESLRLPPLQTQMPTSPTQSESSGGPSAITTTGGTGLGIAAGFRDNQSRGIEAMIMTIPYLNKLKVLSRISPPLAPPAPGSPAVETRGAVIAIEGANAALVKAAGFIIDQTLATSSECAVRVWADGNLPHNEDADPDAEGEADVDAANTGRWGDSSSSRRGSNPFGAYLATIMDWHSKSEDIVKHVTTLPPPQVEGGPRHKTPVALLAGGFSLTISDKYASSVPIADSYAPVDHWQWMATLWRGIVGPDLVVYVREASEDEVNRLGGVDFKTPGVVVVRASASKGLDEKTERRLGFEVMEWVRSGNFRGGFGAF